MWGCFRAGFVRQPFSPDAGCNAANQQPTLPPLLHYLSHESRQAADSSIEHGVVIVLSLYRPILECQLASDSHHS